MLDTPKTLQDYARYALAAIRMLNGILALLAPGFLARRLGVDPDTTPAILYVFRMFGVRTVLVAADLVRPQGDPVRASAENVAVAIHASDTMAALIAGLHGLPRRAAVTIVAISATNTALAYLLRPRPKTIDA